MFSFSMSIYLCNYLLYKTFIHWCGCVCVSEQGAGSGAGADVYGSTLPKFSGFAIYKWITYYSFLQNLIKFHILNQFLFGPAIHSKAFLELQLKYKLGISMSLI